MGGVITPINPLYTAQESAHQILNSNAKMVITHPLFVETAVEAAKIAGVEKLIVFGHDSVAPNAVPFEDIRGFQSDISGATAKGSGDDTCVLPYSSGTTGLPKGTMLTHETIVANLLQVDSAEGRVMFDDTTIISPLPLFHIYGFTMSMLYTAFKGATLVTMERFDMEVFARAIQDYKCTRGHLVPPIVLGVIANEQLREKYDLSSLKMVISAAASLGGNLEEEWERVVKCGIKQGWGMSELSPVGTWIPDDALKKGSVGPPLANSEIKCIDVETGADLPLGEEGEFCFKGPQMMKGYLNLPDKTAECLDLETGWMRTGDVAIINPEDGYVTITDRVKELIKYKGFQVAPAELEALLLKHPAVQDTTVIPRADDDAGEVPRAYVVLAPDYEGGEAKAETDIVAFVAENVAPYKKLRGGVVFTDVIPKSASGKILRRFVVDADRKRDD